MITSQMKQEQIKAELVKLERVVVAFSGGIDSSLLLKLAVDTLGKENVLAVVVNSELFTNEEYENALVVAENFGVEIKGVTMSELGDERIAANTPDSWYYSKQLLYHTIKKVGAETGFVTVLDGMILDDASDFRPGLKARTEAGVRSLLEEVGLCKREVRTLAKNLKIPVWNKVASCSVASRFPYGTKLTVETINQVMAAEAFIRQLGILTVRVRVHGELARIEVLPEDFQVLIENHQKINNSLTDLSFKYITLDCRGYQVGRMNEELSQQEKLAYG